MHARLSRTGVGLPPDSRWRPSVPLLINLSGQSRMAQLAFSVMMPCAPGYAAAQVLVDSAFQARVHAEILATSPALAAADSRITSALALRRAAESAPLTSVAAELEEIPDGINLADAGNIRLTLERELFTGGRRDALGGQAETTRRAAELRRRALAQRLIAESDRWIVGWAASRAALYRLEAEDSLLAAAEEALTARFAAGESRYGDVLRLRTERLRVRSETVAARRAGGEARVRLSALAPGLASWMDSSQVHITVDSMVVGVLPAPSLDSLKALSGRADLLDVEIQQAEAMRAIARSEGRPRLLAGLGAQRFAGENGDFVVGPVLGASVSLPFTSGRARAVVAATDAELSRARAARVATLAELQASMEAARSRYEAAREQVAVYDVAILTASRLEREAALGAYRNGQLSLIELLDFERALARAELDRLRNLVEAASAWAALFTEPDQSDEPIPDLFGSSLE